MSLAVNEAKYATTATPKEFWSVWTEKFNNEKEQENFTQTLFNLKQKALPQNNNTDLFKSRYYTTIKYFNQLGKFETAVTEQDKLLYSLCSKERLLELMFRYILYDDGIKKIARYQQYFAITKTMQRIEKIGSNSKRKGGVIWHTQGSGKSLTMVILAEMIALSKKIKNPKIILVTDRIDLNSQITETFQKCNIPVEEAATGKHLIELIKSQ